MPMDRDEIIAVTRELAEADVPFVLATVDEHGAPQVRWMGGCALDDPMTVWLAGGAKSRKMSQISASARAQLMFHSQDFGRVATVSGECEVVGTIEAKRRLWERMPQLSRYVSGPEDPEFGVIKFVGRRIELLNMAEGMTPAVAEI
jgi:general stress protein 26